MGTWLEKYLTEEAPQGPRFGVLGFTCLFLFAVGVLIKPR